MPITLNITESSQKEDIGWSHPLFITSLIGGLSFVVTVTMMIDRRRSTSKRKSIGTEVDNDILKSSANQQYASNSSGGSVEVSKDGKSSQNNKEAQSNGGKKKARKKEFDVNTQEVLGLGSHGTVVFNGEFQGKNVAVKRFLKRYFEIAKSEINILMYAEHPNIIRYYFYEEDE